MKIAKTSPWHVGFVPCANRGIWRLGRGKFSHCMAFGYDPESDVWLLCEANVWGLDVRTLPAATVDHLMTFCHAEGYLLSVCANRRPQYRYPRLLTCAGTIGALVGLSDWIVTPRQLYGALRRAGATLVSRP